jgi:hypothetical protein
VPLDFGFTPRPRGGDIVAVHHSRVPPSVVWVELLVDYGVPLFNERLHLPAPLRGAAGETQGVMKLWCGRDQEMI